MSLNDESIPVTLMVVEVLESLQIRYVVGGSLASAIHGVSRSTLDSDLVADIQLQHVPLLVERLQTHFYVAMDAIFDAVQHRSSFNLIHLESMFKVDIFVAKERRFEQLQLENRQTYFIEPDSTATVYVASPEEIILAKLEWYRLGGEISDRQWQDILGVLKMQEGRLDMDYLRTTAVELNVLDLLKKALNEST
ncbi:MAG: hypothetical protein AAF639_44930 [Chloroflexota bacterium]